MNCLGPLQVQRAKVFRRDVLAVGLFAQLYLVEVIATPAKVSNFVRGVLRRVVDQPGRQKHRQAVCQATLKDAVKAWLLHSFVQVHLAMPWIG